MIVCKRIVQNEDDGFSGILSGIRVGYSGTTKDSFLYFRDVPSLLQYPGCQVLKTVKCTSGTEKSSLEMLEGSFENCG